MIDKLFDFFNKIIEFVFTKHLEIVGSRDRCKL